MAYKGGVDIVSFTFGTFGRYDTARPIFLDASDESKYITARQALILVRQLVAGLREQGLEKGDCICLHAANNVLYAPLWLGAIGAGGVVSGTNPAYTIPELVQHLTITSARFIIAQEGHLENICEAARQCDISDSCIFIFGLAEELQQDPLPFRPWKVLLGFGEQDWIRIEAEDEQKSTVAALWSTSGTTGLPKAAKVSHRYLVAQSTMIQARKRGSLHNITQLICLPVFHAFAAQLSLVLPLRDGISTYFMPRFKLPDFVNVVRNFQITDVAIVPPIITTLLHLDCLSASGLYSLRYVVCAGAPLNAGIQEKFYGAIHPEGVVAQVWGTTETGWVTAFGSTEKDSSGSVGRCLPDVDVKIVNDDGQVVVDGALGEACVRTPSMYSGYLGQSVPDGTDLDGDGYYHTGDRAYVQDDRVFVDGRIKEIMKVNGWQVSPAELEKILLQHPDIIDVAVVGKERINQDGLKETHPQAFVVRRHLAAEDDPTLVGEDVQTFVASRVVSYKQLTGGVVFVDNIPRNPTGKIVRRLLETPSLDHNDAVTTAANLVTKLAACTPELTRKLRKSLSTG